MTFDPRHKSRALLDGADRAAARSYFRAVGFTDEDLARPLIGIAHCWIELTPCNANHRKLAQKVAEGVRAAGGTPIEFNTISVTDGIAMGTEGMKASLISRDWIADSVELVTRGHLLDGLVTLSGCDKTIPAMVMAMARLDLPSVMLYGGSIMYGEYKGKRMTVQDIFEAIGARNAGKIDDKEPATPSSARRARARAPAVGSSPPTRWPPRSRCSVSRRWASTTCRRPILRRKRSPFRRAGWPWTSCARG